MELPMEEVALKIGQLELENIALRAQVIALQSRLGAEEAENRDEPSK